ncbi:hypothetical protein Tco_0890680 [Tanacetum coccineum]|uniref:Uncharacterized protein n=1 Tax=Tanacetum coccineum TaxID=301880 RepID=A0ABQ5C406_9ASTR
MIWISASETLPFTLAFFVVSTSLKSLFIVSWLSNKSSSSFEELLEVSYRHDRILPSSLPKFLMSTIKEISDVSFDICNLRDLALHIE